MNELAGGDCERLAAGLVAQPANAWSSLAFLAVGVWLARRSLTVHPARRRLGLAYATAVAANGVGSWLFHGPGTVAGKWLHDGAIVAVVGAVALTMPAAGREWRSVASGRRPAPRAGAGALVALLGSGLVVNALSRTGGAWCRPDSLVQGHAYWHVAMAGVLGLWGAWLFPAFPGHAGRARWRSRRASSVLGSATADRPARSAPSREPGTRPPTRSPNEPSPRSASGPEDRDDPSRS